MQKEYVDSQRTAGKLEKRNQMVVTSVAARAVSRELNWRLGLLVKVKSRPWNDPRFEAPQMI
jgi:hypothetical protein